LLQSNRERLPTISLSDQSSCPIWYNKIVNAPVVVNYAVFLGRSLS